MYNVALLRVESVVVVVSAASGHVSCRQQIVVSLVMNRYGAAGPQTRAPAAAWRGLAQRLNTGATTFQVPEARRIYR